MIGLAVQVSPYRKRLNCESSKTFHFFQATPVVKGRIFNSQYLYCWDVRQVPQIRAAEIPINQFLPLKSSRRAFVTLFRKGGQLSIAASNRSPA